MREAHFREPNHLPALQGGQLYLVLRGGTPMYYRDILSGKYYQLPGPCLVRAFRHGQCIELREHSL